MKILEQITSTLLYGMKYGKIVGVLWLVSGIVLSVFIGMYFGTAALVAYLICKFSGVCPI